MSATHPHVRIALPWATAALADASTHGALPNLPSCAWLAGRGVPCRVGSSWRAWLLQAVGASPAFDLDAWPPGPCFASAYGADAGTAGTWAVAQPVHLATALDHLRLAPLADAAPAVDEANRLATTIRAHFAGHAFDLVAFVDGAWLLRADEALEVTTQDPASLVGRNIHDAMPEGRDGARVRNWMNELQMLLHEHPVNERRAQRRSLPINALWLWGFGRYATAASAPPTTLARWELRSDDLWLRALWRAHGGRERALGDSSFDGAGALIAMTQPPTSDPAEALVEVDSSLLARVCQALQSGRLHAVDIWLGGVMYHLDRSSRWRVWRRPARVSALVAE